MKNAKQLTALFLACVMAASGAALSSCSDSKAENNGSDGSQNAESQTSSGGNVQTETQTESETGEILTAPDISGVNMEGKAFNLYVSGWCDYAPLEMTDVCVDELTGEGLDDAAYQRQVKVESDLNCKLSQFIGSGDMNKSRADRHSERRLLESVVGFRLHGGHGNRRT